MIALNIEFENISGIRNMTLFLKEKDVKMVDIETEASDKSDTIAAIVTVRVPNQKMISMIASMISAVDGVVHVEEI